MLREFSVGVDICQPFCVSSLLRLIFVSHVEWVFCWGWYLAAMLSEFSVGVDICHPCWVSSSVGGWYLSPMLSEFSVGGWYLSAMLSEFFVGGWYLSAMLSEFSVGVDICQSCCVRGSEWGLGSFLGSIFLNFIILGGGGGWLSKVSEFFVRVYIC